MYRIKDWPAVVEGSFGKLWQHKLRGNTLEIITPFCTTSDKFVSVFVTQREGSYIVSDAGWLNSGEYENDPLNLIENECFQKLLLHYIHHFEIKTTTNKGGLPIYYKKTTNGLMLSSLILDLSNFISALASAALVQYSNQDEKATREAFSSRAGLFFKEMEKQLNLHVKLNTSLKKNLPVRFNAVVTTSNSLSVISYVTGSNFTYFTNSVARTNMNFELLTRSTIRDVIKHKIPLIDDAAEGYDPEKVEGHLQLLANKADVSPIYWKDRDKLIPMLAR